MKWYQCLDCWHIGPPNLQGACEKCGCKGLDATIIVTPHMPIVSIHGERSERRQIG